MKGPQLSVAYTSIVNEEGYSIGVARQGEKGYYPQPGLGTFETYAAATTEAKRLNEEELGIDERTALKIVASTMGSN